MIIDSSPAASPRSARNFLESMQECARARAGVCVCVFTMFIHFLCLNVMKMGPGWGDIIVLHTDRSKMKNQCQNGGFDDDLGLPPNQMPGNLGNLQVSSNIYAHLCLILTEAGQKIDHDFSSSAIWPKISPRYPHNIDA